MSFAVSPVLIPVVKQVRHRHPSTLHLWWARRPLASWRAMLLALLLPAPTTPVARRRSSERCAVSPYLFGKEGLGGGDIKLLALGAVASLFSYQELLGMYENMFL